ncbi:MAG: DNA polymerase I [Candidatus Kapabacteria bacterium]|nr:DNA polymerase I [Candidatus Kapabacteria bacterium]
MAKIYLVDGMSLVFRAYHAMQRTNLRSPSGEPTFALFGFTNILTALLEKEKPEYLAVVFDTAEPTFRHDLFTDYKANRDAFPDDLAPQLPKIKELLDALNISRIELDGYEADDIIGTISVKESLNGNEVICLTNDKDYYQLVNDKIKIYKPSRLSNEDFDVVTTEKVFEKFGVSPEKVIDVLAIIGDSVDNVPGVKGVGEKTAIPLIQKFGSLEALYDNIDAIDKESLRKKLEENKQNAFLSKELVTIDTNVPIEINLENLKVKPPDFEKLDKFFLSSGFNTLRKRWLEKKGNYIEDENNLDETPDEILKVQEEVKDETTVFKTIKDIDAKYYLINTSDKFNELLNKLHDIEEFAIDLETDSLDRDNCKIVGIAISFIENEAYYIAVYDDFESKSVNSGDGSLFDVTDSDNNATNDSISLTYVIKYIRNLLTNPKIKKIGQNIKFDAYILNRYGIELSPITFDTMLASYVINPDDRHNLDAISKKWLRYVPIPISQLIGEKKSKQISMKDVPLEDISIYACEDADLALKLKNVLEKKLKDEKLEKLAFDIEFPMIEVLVKVESNGVAIDSDALAEISTYLTQQAASLTEKIYEEAGTTFNIDSPKQLSFILFEKLQIPSITKTKTGFSTDVQVLSQLAPYHPIAKYILDYRQIVKLKNTYVDALPKLVNPKTGRIHTTYNQTVASTGRLSSTDPNLQNIPIRTEFGKEVRKAFVPQSKDRLIFAADYSQIELRIMAYYSEDRQLIEAFKNGLDIHASTAAILFNKPINEVTSDMRRIAKTVNFGIMYGLGSYGLSQRIGLSKKESQSIIDNYFKSYPGIKKYMDMTIKLAQEKGYAETLCGRRRYFEQINSQNKMLRTAAERAAINMPIQGSASDMMKIAMINIHNEMKKQKMNSMMIMQVHDELVFEVYKDEADDLKSLVIELMESALPLGDVPIVVDSGFGANWLETK